MLPLNSLPVQLYNQRWNLIHMPKPCLIALTTTFVKILLWSLLSMEVIYALHTTHTSPYLPLYSERLYDHLDLSEINNHQSVEWELF